MKRRDCLKHRRDVFDLTLMLRAPCNYQCYYCCARGVPKNRFTRLTRESIAQYLALIDSFDAPLKIMRVNSYGEPSLLPGIWDLLGALATRGFVMLATNLSFPLEKIMQALPAASTWLLLTSLHPETEEHLGEFLRKCQLLVSSGYPVAVHTMVDDTKLAHTEQQVEYMRRVGLDCFVSPVQGRDGDRRFPYDLGEDTKLYLQERIDELHPQLLLRHRNLAFTGLRCGAGYSRFVVRDSCICPCMNSDRLLGWLDGEFRPFSEPMPCAAFHAESQCLPDEFLVRSRCYCMGDHRLPVGRGALAVDIERFAELKDAVVNPSLERLRQMRLNDWNDQLAGLGRTAIDVAPFGLSIWPYLELLKRHAKVETVLLDREERPALDGIHQASFKAYRENRNPRQLLVLSTVHAAEQARAFVQSLPDSGLAPLCCFDLPASPPEWNARHA